MEVDHDVTQLATAVLHDFSHALLASGGRRQGLSEAEEVLLSYAEELSSAGPGNTSLCASLFEVLQREALAAAARCAPASTWQALLRLTAAVAGWAAPASQHAEQALCAEVTFALLASPEEGISDPHILRLEAALPALPALLGRAGLGGGFGTASPVDPRGALLAALLLHLSLPSASAGAADDGHHQLSDEGEAAVQRLLALAGAAAPPRAGTGGREHLDLPAAQALMQAAFATVASALQAPAVLRRLGSSSSHAAFTFLQRFRAGTPAVGDLWWGVFAAAARQLAAAAERGGPAVLRQPPLQALARAFFHSETAAAVAHSLLALPPAAPPGERQPRPKGGKAGGKQGGGGKKGSILMKHGWASVYEACLEAEPSALLLGAAEVLRPDASYPLNERVAAVQVMGRAVSRFLAQRPRGGEEHLALWPPQALDLTLAALSQDPSIRLRREAMLLLSSMAAPAHSVLEVRLMRAALQRCRDRDGAVRAAGFALLLRYPRQRLHAVLAPGDWRAVLDVGLTPDPEPTAGGGGGRGRPKAGAGTTHSATRLLGLYLTGGKEEEEGEVEEEEEEEEEGGRGATNSGSQGWAGRLRWVLPPAEAAARCPQEGRLGEAYQAALRVLRAARAAAARQEGEGEGEGAVTIDE